MRKIRFAFKLIFVVVAACRSTACAAEMEVPDRLAVDGASLFESTAVFSGNVGIGTTAPEVKLHVYDTNCSASSTLRVRTPGGGEVVISTTGNVGIWTNAPFYNLQVGGGLGGGDVRTLSLGSDGSDNSIEAAVQTNQISPNSSLDLISAGRSGANYPNAAGTGSQGNNGGCGNGTATNGGSGGNGISNSITGSPVTYAGGGRGGCFNGGTSGTAGSGDGGTGGVWPCTPCATDGTDNLGGGGGHGGKGGSGIVIVRYPL